MPASAKTVLFVMQHAGFVRNYEHSLRILHERGHRIHILYFFARARKGEMVLADRLRQSCPGIEIAEAPSPPPGLWSAAARAIRLGMDALRYSDSRFEQTHQLRRRAEEKAPPAIRRGVRTVSRLGDPAVRAVLRGLRRLELAIPVSPAAADTLRRLEPDAVLVTPLVEWGSEGVDWIKAAQAAGIPSGCCVASWDNLTNKGLLKVVPERVFVWNEAQRDEAVALHGVPEANVVVTGAQLFDHWFDRGPSRDREAFCARVGLDPERPFVIFLGSTLGIAPEELYFIDRWIRRLRETDDTAVSRAGILIRPHPSTGRRYLTVDVSQLENTVIWPRYTPDMAEYYTEESKDEFFDSLYHASAAVGINTSAMVEAGIVGCPTCTVRLPEFQHAQDGTLHFSLLTDVAGGLLRVADDFEQHFRDLSDVLSENGGDRARAFVEAFVRPQGLDAPAAPNLADAIEDLADLAPTRSTSSSRISRLVALPIALLLRVLAPDEVDWRGRSRAVRLARRASRGWTRAVVRIYVLSAWIKRRLGLPRRAGRRGARP